MMSQVEKTWIIKQSPNYCPVIKIPEQNRDGIYRMLKELKSLYPDANLIVCQLAYGKQLWVESGNATICQYELLNRIASVARV